MERAEDRELDGEGLVVTGACLLEIARHVEMATEEAVASRRFRVFFSEDLESHPESFAMERLGLGGASRFIVKAG